MEEIRVKINTNIHADYIHPSSTIRRYHQCYNLVYNAHLIPCLMISNFAKRPLKYQVFAGTSKEMQKIQKQAVFSENFR